MKCISFFIDYYEIAPLEILYELYKLKVKGTIEEMIGMLEEMPEDITESCIFPMEKLGMQDLPKENPLYSERGLYVHLPVFEGDGLTALLKQQQNKNSIFRLHSSWMKSVRKGMRQGYWLIRSWSPISLKNWMCHMSRRLDGALRRGPAVMKENRRQN
ncbi:MAG: hypothetical protein ACLR8P_10300 [Clostridium fessum]